MAAYRWRRGLEAVCGLAALALAQGADAAALKFGGPLPASELHEVRTLGSLIRRAEATSAIGAPDRVVHVMFVHGIRADRRGTSDSFRAGLCAKFPELCPGRKGQPRPAGSIRLLIGDMPHANVLGVELWNDAAAWRDSEPFVDRYVYRQGDKVRVIVDEVNWWPLIFPLKCRMLVLPEAQLSGADREHLQLCAGNADHKAPADYAYHRWLTDAELGAALQPAISGGGAWGNRLLKQQLMNWGLSDAVVSLGPMRVYLRRAIGEAFNAAERAEGLSPAQQDFVLASESLGSFIVMDALEYADQPPTLMEAAEQDRVQALSRVMHRTADIYFFANQFPLLELARVHKLPPSPDNNQAPPAAGGATPAPVVSVGALSAWARPQISKAPREGMPTALQIVAFSDPSDVLTYYVPQIPHAPDGPVVRVVNLYDSNAFNWFGLLEDPGAAHTGHTRNPAVLEALFGQDWTRVRLP